MGNTEKLNCKTALSSRPVTAIENSLEVNEYALVVRRYARNIINKHPEIQHYYDELLSFGMFCLFKHLRVFDPSRGEFKSFLINIYYNMRNYAKKISKNNPDIHSLYDDEIENEYTHCDIDTKLTAYQVLTLLNSTEQKLLIDRYFNSKTLQEIADEYGVTKESIRQRINSILAKCRKKLKLN